jgi:hypothetical protein
MSLPIGVPLTPATAHPRIRWSLAIVACIVVAAILCYSAPLIVFWIDVQSKKLTLGDIEYNEQVKASLDVTLDQAKSIFQVSLVVIGVVWGLIIVKADKALITKTDDPELLMFFLTNLLLLIQFLSYYSYTTFVADAYAAGAVQSKKPDLFIPNVFQPKISSLLPLQLCALVGAVVIGGLTSFSTNVLKGKPQ